MVLHHFTCSGRFFQYFATLSASLSTVAIGVNTGWSSPYLPYLLSNSSTIPTTTFEGTWCATAVLIGCLFGAILGASIADRLGRINSMLLLAPITVCGFLGMAFARNIWVLTVLRLIIGITDGAIYTVLPLFIGETVDADIRGFLSSTLSTFFLTGNLLINIIGPFMSIFSSSLVVVFILVVHFILILFTPESPYYYVKIKKYELAKESLRIYRGENRVTSDLENLRKFILIESKSSSEKSRFLDLFTVPSNRKACLICFLLMFTNRMSGKMAIMLFTAQIFSESGSTIDANLSTVIYNTVELGVTLLVTYFIIDRFGKRKLIITSGLGSSLTIFLLAIYFYLKERGSPMISSLNWLPITSLILYNILYSIGLSYATPTYVSELFPMDVKANAASMAEFTVNIIGIISSNFFQYTFVNYGMHVPFFCFAICSGVSVIFIYKLVPETKGKSLVEIQEFLMESCKKETTPD